MPWSPKKACLQPLCPGYAEEGCKGRCREHWLQHRRATEQARGPRHRTVYNRQYRKRRQQALRKAKGLCQRCGIRPAVETHHSIAVAQGGKDSELVPLCLRCHREITREQLAER